jgi:FAD/FMN-containing dehydrogenase
MEKVTHFAHVESCRARVHRPEGLPELLSLVREGGSRGFSLWGSGCNFNDQAYNQGGDLIDLSRMNRIIGLDETSVTVQAGIKISHLLDLLLEKGFYLPGLPGSLSATVGGAVSNTVIGKDSHKHGIFSENVLSLKLVNSDGELIELRPESKWFPFVAGGLGWMGVIVEVKLRILPVPGNCVSVWARPYGNFGELFGFFTRYAEADFLFAWHDSFSAGGGVFLQGFWSSEYRRISSSPWRSIVYQVGVNPAARIANNRAFMRFAYWMKRLRDGKAKQSVVPARDFCFPARKFPGFWSLFPGGVVELHYSFPEVEAEKACVKLHELFRKLKVEPWMTHVKKIRKGISMLSFAQDGYAICFGLPKRAFLRKEEAVLSSISEILRSHCGKPNLAKDFSRLSYYLYDSFPFAEVVGKKLQLDPRERFVSDFYRRVKEYGKNYLP